VSYFTLRWFVQKNFQASAWGMTVLQWFLRLAAGRFAAIAMPRAQRFPAVRVGAADEVLGLLEKGLGCTVA
jgi:hypothetical protein